MKLSIITINYNNGIGLEQTIKSVINQTSKEFEYIIIDGASNDGSVDIIKQYESKINYWVSEPDSGIYNAMNKGIKAAKGEYCQFLNSGDCLVKEDVTEKMLKNIPDTSIIIGNMLKSFPNGKLIVDKGLGNEKPTFLTFYKGTLNHSPAYIRRNLFNKYGYYDESLKIVSDWKWYLITVGLNNETLVYKNIDVSIFDMGGVSNQEKLLLKKERRTVLEGLIHKNILIDYDKYGIEMHNIKRGRKYAFFRFIYSITEKLIAITEKM